MLHRVKQGNADWVIDEDNSTPQRIPTPLQSTITQVLPLLLDWCFIQLGYRPCKKGHKLKHCHQPEI